MGQDDLIKVRKDAPFRPFRIHLSDGRSLEVRHSELVLVGRRTAYVFFPSPHRPPPTFDDYQVVALRQITTLEPLEPSPSSESG